MEIARKKILFIINPKSGVKKHSNIVDLISLHLDNKLFESNFVFTEGINHATDLAKMASQNNVDIVVAVGGDGTVREVAKGLVDSDTKLAVIPRGSGNGFANHFNIPLKINKAIEIINKQKSLLIDTAKINEEYFGNIAGVGFDAKIAYEFSKLKKRGLFSYIKLIFIEFFNYKSIAYIIKLDDKSFSKKAFLISVANGSQFGNRAFINPEASATDGLLEVCILRKPPLLSTPILIIKLLNKRLHKSKYLEVYQTKNVLISNNDSDVSHIDGDTYESGKELSITINPASLNLIIP